ncbi:MAG: hypothetical protein Q8936_12620 [Bacillota bacterium]|nr:hypothetical protein [Bacillota bacterium]
MKRFMRIIKLVFLVILIALLAIVSISCKTAERNPKEWAKLYGYKPEEVLSIEVGTLYRCPLLKGKINGLDAYVLFDTGNIAEPKISPAMRKKLDLKAVDSKPAYNSKTNTSDKINTFLCKKFSTLNENYTNLNVVEARDNKFDSSISLSMLINKRFTIDYKNRMMAISNSSSLGYKSKGEVLPLITNNRYKGMIVVKGTVNGRDALIQIDTGKGSTSIDKKLVSSLNLNSKLGIYEIDNIKLGCLVFSSHKAKVSDFSHISNGYSQPITLSLGSDIISQFVLTVDYQNNVVIINSR